MKKDDPRAATAFDQGIGARIRARRLEMGVSQEKLAGAIGVTFQQVQKYEKGLNRVSASTLFDIARTLNVEITALMPKAMRGEQQTPVDAPGAADLLTHYAALGDPGRKVLLDTARTLSAEPRLRRGSRP